MQRKTDQPKPAQPQDEDRSPARRKDRARDTSDEKGRDVPGADAIDSAGAEEDTYD